MSANTDLETTLRRYVLGELKDEARLQLEERLVTAPEVFESLGVVEDELAEEYVNGRLSETERIGFERSFLCTADRRWQVRFIEMLKDHASASAIVHVKSQAHAALPVLGDAVGGAATAAEPAIRASAGRIGRRWSLATLASLFQPQPVWRPALAAAVVVLLAGNLWFARRSVRLESEVARLSVSEQEGQFERRQLQMRLEELSAKARLGRPALPEAAPSSALTGTAAAPPRSMAEGRPARVLAPAVAPAIPTFALTTGLLRGEGSLTRIAPPAGAEVVRLRLPVQAIDYPLYRASLEDADGEEIWAHSKLTASAAPGGGVIVVLLPADLLRPGDYQLRLSRSDGSSAPESVGSYSFRVAGRATNPR